MSSTRFKLFLLQFIASKWQSASYQKACIRNQTVTLKGVISIKSALGLHFYWLFRWYLSSILCIKKLSEDLQLSKFLLCSRPAIRKWISFWDRLHQFLRIFWKFWSFTSYFCCLLPSYPLNLSKTVFTTASILINSKFQYSVTLQFCKLHECRRWLGLRLSEFQ